MSVSINPSYLQSDGSDIMKMLQRFNIQGQKEIDIFQSLVKIRKSKILYQDALEATNLKNNSQLFMNVMEKFEECQIAVFRHDSQKNNSEDKDYVRLCDEGSLVFYAEYITEMITALNRGTNTLLPLVSEIEKKGIKIPKNFIKAYNTEFVKSLQQSASENVNEVWSIISIQVQNETFLFTPSTLPFICEMCIRRVQSLTEQGNIIHTLARVFDLTLSEMRLKIESRDLLTWKNLSDTIYSKMDSLKGQQDFKAYPDFFIIFGVLHFLLKTKILQIESEHQFNESCVSFSNSIITKMLETPDGMLEQQFQNLLQETAQKLSLTDTDKCIEKFLSESVISASDFNGNNLLPIINMDKFYIHTNDLKHVISDRYFKLENKLADHYQKLLKKYLSGSLSPKEIVFFNEDTLETSVHEKIMKLDELYYKILKHPIILASIIIESGKEAQKNDNDTQDNYLKRSSNSGRLNLFFNIQTQRLLQWYVIFNLNIPKLGEQAYQQLGFFRKLLLLFTGRYQSLRTRLRRLSTTSSGSGALQGKELKK